MTDCIKLRTPICITGATKTTVLLPRVDYSVQNVNNNIYKEKEKKEMPMSTLKNIHVACHYTFCNLSCLFKTSWRHVELS